MVHFSPVYSGFEFQTCQKWDERCCWNSFRAILFCISGFPPHTRVNISKFKFDLDIDKLHENHLRGEYEYMNFIHS